MVCYQAGYHSDKHLETYQALNMECLPRLPFSLLKWIAMEFRCSKQVWECTNIIHVCCLQIREHLLYHPLRPGTSWSWPKILGVNSVCFAAGLSKVSTKFIFSYTKKWVCSKSLTYFRTVVTFNTIWVHIPSSLLSSMTWSRLPEPPLPQFSHLQNGSNNIMYLNKDVEVIKWGYAC